MYYKSELKELIMGRNSLVYLVEDTQDLESVKEEFNVRIIEAGDDVDVLKEILDALAIEELDAIIIPASETSKLVIAAGRTFTNITTTPVYNTPKHKEVSTNTLTVVNSDIYSEMKERIDHKTGCTLVYDYPSAFAVSKIPNKGSNYVYNSLAFDKVSFNSDAIDLTEFDDLDSFSCAAFLSCGILKVIVKDGVDIAPLRSIISQKEKYEVIQNTEE